MKIVRLTIGLLGLCLAACGETQPPISVAEFMENPRLLEATMVQCSQNRSEMKYEAECVNAREAINRLETAEERARREDLEAQSERKRQALRRTQEAAAAARARAIEEQRRREQAEYLGLYEQPAATDATVPDAAANAPIATVEPEVETDAESEPTTSEPGAEPSDLGAIREELRRRQQPPEQGQ